MTRFRNQNFLLSHRGRSLPVLWLLVFLAPYLAFFLASAPHFHASKLPDADSLNGLTQTAQAKSAPEHFAQHSSATSENASCLACEWTACAASQTVHASFNLASLTLPAEYSAPATSHVAERVFCVASRGPPLS